ncbi:hypothetical protein M8C21_002401, partial [Ambrosia artemisiifolia]
MKGDLIESDILYRVLRLLSKPGIADIRVDARPSDAINVAQRCKDLTRIKFLTDGVLLREMMDDPLLSNVIMVDEAHERCHSHYSELPDIKRVIVNTQAIDP